MSRAAVGAAVTGNTFNNSGNFAGATLFQASTVHNAGTIAGRIGAAAGEDRAELQTLLTRLGEALAALPTAQGEAAQAVGLSAEALMTEAAAAAPNKPLLRIKGRGLLEAVKGIAAAAPGVLDIAERIVGLVAKIHGLG